MFKSFFKKEADVTPTPDVDPTFRVPLTTITKVENHPWADRLSICTVYGFQVITGKDQYKVGDLALYVPIDSILSSDIENKLFPPDSKIKLNKSRVRQIRIRKAISQGMLINVETVKEFFPFYPTVEHFLETDFSNVLDITKYTPPFKDHGNAPGTKKLRNRAHENPHFRKFNGISNLKWSPNRFEGEEVVIQSKTHGTHVRFGKAPFVANTVWKKIKKLFGLVPKYEFVYGSNNVELTNKSGYKGFYDEDIYGVCLKKYDVVNKIKDGEFVHGEIYGPGIQANYDYGVKEHSLLIFDVRVMNDDGTQKWLNPEECEAYAKERGFNFAPVLYTGMFSQEALDKCTFGPDPIWAAHPREGCVVKSRYKYDILQNKQCLKSINPAYLDDQTNTDNH